MDIHINSTYRSDMWIVDVSDAMFSSYLVLGKMDQVQAGPHIKKRTEERILDQVACPLMHGQDTILWVGTRRNGLLFPMLFTKGIYS